MRALMILAVLLPLGIVFAWAVARKIVAAQDARRTRAAHIRELEQENDQLDEMLAKISRRQAQGTRRP